MGWLLIAVLLLALIALIVSGLPLPQSSVHVQPQAAGGAGVGVVGAAGGGVGVSQSTPGPAVVFATGGGVGGVRRTLSQWREWRRADPTLINSLWRSKMGNGIRKQLGNAEVYIMLALLIGLVTVVIGCWLSDNCWSPDPEGHVITVA